MTRYVPIHFHIPCILGKSVKVPDELNCYNCHDSGHYLTSSVLFKTQRFGDRILYTSSGGTYSKLN
jgi:hypothetical protein